MYDVTITNINTIPLHSEQYKNELTKAAAAFLITASVAIKTFEM